MILSFLGFSLKFLERVCQGEVSISLQRVFRSPFQPKRDLPGDIVLFGFFLKYFKTCLLGRGFHIFIQSVSFSSPEEGSYR